MNSKHCSLTPQLTLDIMHYIIQWNCIANISQLPICLILLHVCGHKQWHAITPWSNRICDDNMDCGDGDVKISGRMGMGMKLRDGVQMGKIHS